MLCMHHTYISSSRGQKSTCSSQKDFPTNGMDRFKISKWEVVLGAPDRVNKPCLMHDNHLCRVWAYKLLYPNCSHKFNTTEKCNQIKVIGYTDIGIILKLNLQCACRN